MFLMACMVFSPKSTMDPLLDCEVEKPELGGVQLKGLAAAMLRGVLAISLVMDILMGCPGTEQRRHQG